MKGRASIIRFRPTVWKRTPHAQQAVHGALSYCAKHLCAVRSLSNVLTSPTKERTELVRKNHEVDDERYRGQHKYQVSHGSFPALICAVRSLPNRVIKVRQ